MKINFTKKEFETLLDMIFLADWMLHSQETEPSKDAYRALEQRIFSYAKDFGCEDKIEFDPDNKEFSPTQDYEQSEAFIRTIEDYNTETFWEELIGRLSMRDILRRHGEEGFNSMSIAERGEALAEAEKPYLEEFQSFGLDRIIIKKT